MAKTLRPFEDVYNLDSITINVTNRCNLSCEYCFEHAKLNQDMTPETAVHLIDIAEKSRMHNDRFLTVNIFGGEPLLNWEAIKAILDRIEEKEYKMNVGITTNLTVLTDEMIEYFDLNNVMLLVSIDGLKHVHDKNRCNSYDIVSKNIERLKENGLSLFIEARMTIQPEDVKYALDGIKNILSMGIDNIAPMMVYDTKWTDEQLKNLEEHYINTLDFYCSILDDESYNRNISIKHTDDVLLNVMSPEVDDPVMCAIYSDRWCAIDYNGDIYPCHQCPTSEEPYKSNSLIGNIYSGVDMDKFKKVDLRAKYEYEKCDGCIGKSICKGGCISENYRSTALFDKPGDDYCNGTIALVKAVKKYQEKIINSKHIRNRRINMLKTNLELKSYIDDIFENTDLNDDLSLSIQMKEFTTQIDTLISNGLLLPTFEQYFQIKLKVILAYIMARDNVKFLKDEEDSDENC